MGLLVHFTVASTFSQMVDVPTKIHWPLFAKVLAFDRSLTQHADTVLNVGVIYQSRFRQSTSVLEQLRDAMSDDRSEQSTKRPTRIFAIDLETPSNLTDLLEKEHVDVLYVTPLRGVDLGTITEQSRLRKILTVSGVAAYAERGITITVGLDRERPRILINKTSAKAEGIDLNPQVIRIAKFIE